MRQPAPSFEVDLDLPDPGLDGHVQRGQGRPADDPVDLQTVAGLVAADGGLDGLVMLRELAALF